MPSVRAEGDGNSEFATAAPCPELSKIVCRYYGQLRTGFVGVRRFDAELAAAFLSNDEWKSQCYETDHFNAPIAPRSHVVRFCWMMFVG